MNKSLLEILKYIKLHGVTSEADKQRGLCYKVRRMSVSLNNTDRNTGLLRTLFKEWPYFSGIIECPIPASLNSCQSECQPFDGPRDAYFLSNNKWDESTEYGKARWAFIDWAIERLEKKDLWTGKS